MLAVLHSFSVVQRQRHLFLFRPFERPTEDPKGWWIYAFKLLTGRDDILHRKVSSYLISSYLISSYLTLSHLILYHLIPCPLISSHLILSHLISSHTMSSHLISSYLTLSHNIIDSTSLLFTSSHSSLFAVYFIPLISLCCLLHPTHLSLLSTIKDNKSRQNKKKQNKTKQL